MNPLARLLQATVALPIAEARRVVDGLAAADPADFAAFIGTARGPAEERAARDAAIVRTVREGLAQDLRPLGDALWQAYQSGDFSAVKAVLKKLPTGNATTDALSDLLMGDLMQAMQ